MLGLLLILFTLVPALEFYLLFKVGSQLGATSTFFIIILTGIIGAALARVQGASIIKKVQSELSQGQLPGNQILQGFIVFGGGLLLLTPGFLTDILGLSMVLPGPRHFFVHYLKSYLMKGIKNGNITFMSNMRPPQETQRPHPRPQSEFNNAIDSSDTIEAEFKKK